MPVPQVLSFRAVLQVLLQAVAPLIAANGRDGGSVDDVSVSRSHGERWSVIGNKVGLVAGADAAEARAGRMYL